MGSRSRPRQGLQEHVSPGARDGRNSEPGSAHPDSTGAGGKGAGAADESGGASRRTHTITRLDDGTICIGADCAIIRIPPSGDIQIDARDCPDDVARALTERLNEGAGADFKLKPRKP